MSDAYTEPPGGIPVPTKPASIRNAWVDELNRRWGEDPEFEGTSRVGPSEVMPDSSPTTVAITWPAFPAQATGAEKYALAEELGYRDHRLGAFLGDKPAPSGVFDGRQHQDEYLEWRSAPTEAAGIAAVDMTCEPPDVWEVWFKKDRKSCAQAYSDLLGTQVKDQDLLAPKGLTVEGASVIGYNPRNRFNTTDGIVHLTQRANTLGAEVNLAQDAGRNWRRGTDGELFPNKTQLCKWTGIGVAGRNSDPNIAWAVYTSAIVAQPGLQATLTGPVGLYITDWDRSGRVTLGGEPVGDDWWHVGHGTTPSASPIVLKDPAGVETVFQRVVRLRFAPPTGTVHEGRPALVTDCEIDGETIHHGGQLVELVTMGLFVDAWPLPAGTPLPRPIPRDDPEDAPRGIAPPPLRPYHR